MSFSLGKKMDSSSSHLPPIRPISQPRFSLLGAKHEGSQTARNNPPRSAPLRRPAPRTSRVIQNPNAREGRVVAVLSMLERRRHLPEVLATTLTPTRHCDVS